MSNGKTCGDCHHFDGRYNLCAVTSDFCTVEHDYSACDDFEQKPKPTNGDRIRQKSNEEFARDYVHYHSKFKVYVARLCPLNKQLWTTREEAEKANLEWLNAPAENEVCVSKNAKNDTQADLCITDDTQDQEVKHE